MSDSLVNVLLAYFLPNCLSHCGPLKCVFFDLRCLHDDSAGASDGGDDEDDGNDDDGDGDDGKGLPSSPRFLATRAAMSVNAATNSVDKNT